MTEPTHFAPASPLSAGLVAAAAWIVPLALSYSSSPSPNHPRTQLWYKTLRMPAFKPPDAAVPIARRGRGSRCSVRRLGRLRDRHHRGDLAP